MMKPRNEILEISFEFALKIIEFTDELDRQKKYAISQQLIRSGTSVGANIREAQSCESKRDFIHKLKIAHKEAEETEYWLLLCQKAPSYPSPENNMFTQLLSIQKLLSAIISTTRKNMTKK